GDRRCKRAPSNGSIPLKATGSFGPRAEKRTSSSISRRSSALVSARLTKVRLSSTSSGPIAARHLRRISRCPDAAGSPVTRPASFPVAPGLAPGVLLLLRTDAEPKRNFLFASISVLCVLRCGNDQCPFGRISPFDQATPANQLDTSLRQEPERQRIQSMLDIEHTGSKRCGGIVVAYGHRCLRNDRAGIGLRDDEVNRRTRDLHARLESLVVRIETGKGRQEGRVGVEHTTLPMQYEVSRQEAQEAAKTHQFQAIFMEACRRRALEGGPIFPVWRVVAHGRGNGMRLRVGEPRRIRPVRDYQRDLGGVGALLRRLAQRGHVGAAPGDQDGDALLGPSLTGKDTAARKRRQTHPKSPLGASPPMA